MLLHDADILLSNQPNDNSLKLPTANVPTPVFYTIGYEGLGIQKYLEILTKYGIKTLVDIRHNPSSRNLSFNRTRLHEILTKKGIKYDHRPELGIPSEVRRKGGAMNWYRRMVVPKITPALIDNIERQPACFMCVENDINSCHRLEFKKTLEHQGMSGQDISQD